MTVIAFIGNPSAEAIALMATDKSPSVPFLLTDNGARCVYPPYVQSMATQEIGSKQWSGYPIVLSQQVNPTQPAILAFKGLSQCSSESSNFRIIDHTDTRPWFFS